MDGTEPWEHFQHEDNELQNSAASWSPFQSQSQNQLSQMHSLILSHEHHYKSLFEKHERLRMGVYEVLEAGRQETAAEALRRLRDRMLNERAMEAHATDADKQQQQENATSSSTLTQSSFIHEIEQHRIQRESQMRNELNEMAKEQRRLRRTISTLQMEKSQVEKELLQTRDQLQHSFVALKNARTDSEHWKTVLQKKIKKLRMKKKKRKKSTLRSAVGGAKKMQQVNLSELDQLKLQLQMQKETHESELQSLKERYSKRLEKHKTEINSLRLSLTRDFHDSQHTLQKRLEEQHNKELKTKEQLLTKRMHNLKDVYEQKLQQLSSELQQLRREQEERRKEKAAAATSAASAKQHQEIVEILVSPLSARMRKSPQKLADRTIRSPQLKHHDIVSSTTHASPPPSPKLDVPNHSIVLHGLNREQKTELEEKISVLKFKFSKALEQQHEQYKSLRDKYKTFKRQYDKADHQNNDRVKYVRESMKKHYEEEICRLKDEMQLYYESILHDDQNRYEVEVTELKQELRKLLLETEKVKAEYKFQSMIQEQQLRRRNLQIMRSQKLTSQYISNANSLHDTSVYKFVDTSSTGGIFGDDESIAQQPKVEYETVDLGSFDLRNMRHATGDSDSCTSTGAVLSSTTRGEPPASENLTSRWIQSEDTLEPLPHERLFSARNRVDSVAPQDGSSFLVDSEDEDEEEEHDTRHDEDHDEQNDMLAPQSVDEEDENEESGSTVAAQDVILEETTSSIEQFEQSRAGTTVRFQEPLVEEWDDDLVVNQMREIEALAENMPSDNDDEVEGEEEEFPARSELEHDPIIVNAGNASPITSFAC